jgi:predicted DNA binding CopG/RHH family protein
MMAGTKGKLPSFRSDREERDFWDRHSVEEFAEELEEVDVQIRPARTEQIALRLYKDDIETLKKLAKRRGVGHTTLARSIVEQWLARSRAKPGRSAYQSHHTT